MKQIVFAHGEKGGVGKSTLATVLVELAPSRPVIAECDRTAPDVARRYRKAGYVGLNVPLLSNDAPVDILTDFMSVLEDVNDDLVVVNLPSAAGMVVNQYARLIAEVCDELKRELVVAYVVGAGADSVRSAMDCARDGLAHFAVRRIAVLNGHFGSESRARWTDEAERVWRGTVVEMPGLPQRVSDHVRRVEAPLKAIAKGSEGGMHIIERNILRDWLRDCAPIAEAVYG